MEDRRCKLGLQGRLELVQLVDAGATFRQAAACLGVAPGTAHRWWHRWKAASERERSSRDCLRTRSSRPRSCPWALTAEQGARDPDRPGEDQLRADAAAVSLRPAPFNDLEGAPPPRCQPPAAH